MKIKALFKNIISPPILLIHLFFLVYALLAILYYKERLFGDASYFIFHLINDESFRVEHQRFVQLFFQIIPLAAVKLSLPYKIVLILYSLGNVIYFYIITAICVFGLKDNLAAFCIILLLMFGTTYLYFCPIFEIWYGLALAILFFAMLKKNNQRPVKSLILLALVELLAIFSHPLAFLLILFFIALDYLDNKKWDRSHTLFLGMILLWATLKPLLLSEYEGGKMGFILDTEQNKSYLNLISVDYLIDLGRLMVDHYAVPLVMALLSAVYFLIYEYKKHMYLLLFAIIGYLVLINVTHIGAFISFYMERMYLILVPLGTVPFIYYVFGRLRSFPRTMVLIVLCFLIYKQFNGIRVTAANYTERVEHVQRLYNYTKQFPGSKFIVNENNFKKSYNEIEWSLPVESVLYSSLDGVNNTTTICTEEDMVFENNFEKLDQNNFLFRRWDVIADNELNEKYFSMKTGDYYNLSEYCCVDSIDHFFNSCLSVEVKAIPKYIRDTRSYVRVHLYNTNDKELCSNLEENIYLSYHWYQGQYPVIWDGLRTPIEVNLIGEHSQDIAVQMPAEPGNYTLVVDFMIEGRGWFGVDGWSGPVEIY